MNRVKLTTLVMIGTDCNGESNYHTITTTTDLHIYLVQNIHDQHLIKMSYVLAMI